MSDDHRRELEAARLRRDALRAELEAVERELGSLGPLVERRRDLGRELAAARESLDRAERRRLPLLASVRIASPCEASWDEMDGDDRARHCGACDQKVYDLSAMDAEEAEALLRASGESMCVRYYERADGTVLTSDCSVGAARRRRRRRWAAAGAAALLAAGAAGSALTIGAPPPAELEGCALAETPPPPRAANASQVGQEVAQRADANQPRVRPRMGRPVLRHRP